MGSSSSKASSGKSADAKLELHISDAVDQLRKIPHIQPNSLTAPYSGNNRHLSLDLTCKVNAPVQCRVSIFMMGKEDEDGSVHSDNPVRSLVCQSGFLQEFPGEEHQHIMKLTDIASQAKQYMTVSEGVYPIVIRVESYASRFSVYGLHQLPVPDSPQMQGYMSYLNVHTVFARLQMRAGGWKVDVLQQHLWLKGTCYVLPDSDTLAQYTLHQEPSPPSTPRPTLVATPPKRKPQLQVPAARPALCLLCDQRPVQVTNFPCNHACMCLTCAQRQVHMLPYCPKCKQALQRCIPLSNQGGAAA